MSFEKRDTPMSRELRDKADVMMKELSEMLKPLREEILSIKTGDSGTSAPHDSLVD
ncbi:MAG: hypothetical protein ACRCUT_02585 [Spirochaetota bacterium]